LRGILIDNELKHDTLPLAEFRLNIPECPLLDDLPSTNRRPVTILFLPLFIVMVGFGVIMPILLFYVERLGATVIALTPSFGWLDSFW
jgi:hypothetical protein